MIDPDDASPAAAAGRELLEETGYRAGRIESLGVIDPNPAILANRCHSYLASGLERVGEPALDGKEDIRVIELPLAEVLERARRGQISHALVLVALTWLMLRRPDLAPPIASA